MTHYTIDNGLPQSSVTNLASDNNGFLWVGTQGGLCRFDGQRFVNYTSGNSILENDRIGNLTTGTNGIIQLWLPYTSGCYYVDKHYQIQLYHRSDPKKIFLFAGGKDPIIQNRLLHCKSTSGTTQDFDLHLLMIFNENRRVIPVDSSQLFCYKEDSLFHINLRSLRYRSYLFPKLHTWLVLDDCLLVFDKYWQMAMWKGEEKIVSPNISPRFQRLVVRLKQTTSPVSFKHSSDGRMAFIIIGREIWVVRLNGGLWDAILLYDELDPELPVYSLHYNEAGGLLFIGTNTDGLFVIRKNPFETIIFDDKNSVKNCVYGQLQIDDHTVINSFYRYDPVSGNSQSLKNPIEFTAFFQSSDGRFWHSNDSNIYISGANLVEQKTIPLRNRSPIFGIRSFVDGGAGKVWVCTDNSLGYVKEERLEYLFTEEPYFLKNNITTLFLFDKERIWLGNTNGIAVYNTRTHSIEHNFLTGNYIRSIYKAKDGSIWVSTYGNGIYKFLKNEFVRLPLDNQKSLLFAHCLVEDNDGFFWIPTNNGLFQCKKTELDAYVVSKKNRDVYYYRYKKAGAYTDEFNGGVGQSYTWFHNLLLLPSMQGVLRFDPRQVRPLLPNGKIVIENVTANGKPIIKQSDFYLPPGTPRLELEVSAPYFGDPSNNRLEYQLKEVSERWFPVIGGTIVYNSLPKGSYHLTIRKRTGFGINNYAYKKVNFTVQPFWYETLWFWLAAVLSLSGVVYLLIRKRIRGLQKAKHQLEQKVAERTSELEFTVEELSVSEQELSRVNMVQEQALAVILHDIRSPLSYLSVSARYFNRNIGQLSQEEIVEYSNSLVLSTSTIDKFSNDLVQWLSFNRDNQKLHNEAIDLPKLLNDIKNLYNEIAALNNNVIEVKDGGVERVVADWNKLYLVVRNLVDNATKHCSNGTITLSGKWTADGDGVEIEVADTGSGIAAEELRKWQTDTDTPPDFQKDKLGLSMVTYFVRLMKGKLDVASESGKGTRITIILPG